MKITLLVLMIFIVNALYSGEITIIAPVAHNGIKVEQGKIGKTATFNVNSKLFFNVDRIQPAGGTIELIVKRNRIANQGNSALITVGVDDPICFFIGEQNGQLTFIYRKKTQDGKYEFSSTIKSLTQIKDDEWTHLAFVWGYQREHGCIMQIYINGKTAEEKFRLSFGREWTNNDIMIGIGCNTADIAAASFTGMIDELHISNYPKSFNEINADYEEFAMGRSPKLEHSTLLLLHFDNDLAGTAAVDAGEISKEQMMKYCTELINDSQDL